MPNDHGICPCCKAPLAYAGGIGPYCATKDCEVIDDSDIWPRKVTFTTPQDQPNTQGNEPARDDLVERLWDILDDIDTADDIAKGDDAFYRARVRHLQAKRWETGITTDGQTLKLPARTTPVTNSEDAFVAGAKAMQDLLPDEIDLFRAIRKAGRSNSDKAGAAHALIDRIRALDPTALRPSHMEGGK